MTLKKSIRLPENWQDFETLCKKLFGEVWDCAKTIKKNGRLGQSQSGVDIYGKPKGETEYWGIQRKGKDNYSNSKLTEQEIEAEIEKALEFKPKLATFVFATTAPKDAEIEKFVRIKDQESCAKGDFQIDLYSWQDIADLIEENRDTFNWYVNEIQFKDKYDVEVLLDTGKPGGVATPKFLKKITNYELKVHHENPSYGIGIGNFQSRLITNTVLPKYEAFNPFFPNKVNHSWCSIKVFIKNSGSMVIEDWKFWLPWEPGILDWKLKKSKKN